MTRLCAGPGRFVFLAVLLLLAMPPALHAAPAVAPSACAAGAQQDAPPRALAMAAAARQEHIAFGAQTMDAEGRLVTAGDSEAEDTRRTLLGTPPWQRVLGYWAALDADEARRLPSQVRFGGLRPADRALLEQALNQVSADRLQGLGVGLDLGLEASELRAAKAAVDRVAVIDTPWSAAFISWTARQAGLGEDEFAFSAAHVDYAAAARQAGSDEAAGRSTRYAMRACELRQTAPRVGDLVCQARAGAAGLDSFEKIGEALVRRGLGGPAIAMHCGVVVATDALGFETVGGNVLQSVTRRRLDFAAGTRWLDASYFADGCSAGTAGCVDRHMSRQPWSLLLQWR